MDRRHRLLLLAAIACIAGLLQVAREALVRSAPRCRDGEPAEPYLRRCIQGALHHHLRDRVRLVRISRREHE